MSVTAPRGATNGRANGSSGEEPSVGQLVQEASGQFSTLLRGEIELAKVEITSSVKNAGTGIGFFGAAGVLLVFALTFFFIGLAESLVALHIWRWAAYFIVFGLLFVAVALLGLFGFLKVKRVKAPERTITTSKETVAFLKRPTQQA
jgi:uncharacterized membrane protein YqjE